MLENENMKVTERQLRRIIKETLHHMAAAAAASSKQGRPGIRRRASKMDTTPDASSLRSGSSSGSSVGTPQDLSGGKAKQMYDDLRKGRSKEFFDIVDDIDMYTKAREVDVVMSKETDESEIVADMKIYNRDNQKGGFTEENYKEWVYNVCPILKHNMHFYRKFENVWKGLSLMPESKLRQIIRSVIKESQMNEMIDMMYAGTPYETGPHGDLEQALSADLPKNSREAERAIRLALTKLTSFLSIVPQTAIGTVPAIGAAFATGNVAAGTIGVGVFIATFLAHALATHMVGAEEIEGVENLVTYLDEHGYRRTKVAELAIEEILDREGY